MTNRQRISSIGLLSAGLLASGQAQAVVLDKQLTINFYQFCDDGGTNCAALGGLSGDKYFASSTSKIFAQAGIRIVYNFVEQIFSTHFNTLVSYDQQRNVDAFEQTYRYANARTVENVYLIHSIDGPAGVGGGTFGGSILGMDDINNSGYVDILAHELGHSFGLEPASDPESSPTDPAHSTNPNELMSTGRTHNFATSNAQITPDGAGYDQLSAFQIAYIRKSPLLTDIAASVPEPATWALVVSGFGLIGAAMRRRRMVSLGG